jgi:DNA polymerase-3 subunit gamma/tau
MSDYLVSARKWRPMRFADVVGQAHVTQTLVNAIAAGRMAHAVLFTGPRGVGKTTTARILAKALNCENPQGSEPCNVCAACVEITEGRSMDILEIDGASNNSVDDVRRMRESVKYPPSRGSYRMYIIDEVHMLSSAAFNALLKTLEEPPPHVLFVFATTEIQKVPDTIVSRCQRFDFRRMEVEAIVAHLRAIGATDGITADDEALEAIARKADGAMRDALGLLDQVVAFSGAAFAAADVRRALNLIDEELFFRASDLLAARDRAGVFPFVAELFSAGHDPTEFLSGFATHVRNLLAAAATGSAAGAETTAHFRARTVESAKRFSVGDLQNILAMLLEALGQVRYAALPRVRLEFLLLEMASLERSAELGILVAELESLRRGGRAPAPRSSGSASPDPAPLPPPAPRSAGPRSEPPPAASRAASARAASGASAPAANGADEPPEAKLERWETMIESIRADGKLSLYGQLHNAVILPSPANLVRIGCPDEAVRLSCERYKDEILSRVRAHFGNDARFEAAPAAAPAREAAPEDPKLARLIRALDAEEL